jgi:hypothetical protein
MHATDSENPVTFDYSLPYHRLNFRRHPELYHIGRGEQGVLLVEPYKSELLPHWRFQTPVIARQSADTIYALFLDYKKRRDFVGMDMARKFLQMGYTRARRYANHKSGRKWSAEKKQRLPLDADVDKAEAARFFYEAWAKARTDAMYLRLKRHHLKRYGRPTSSR